MKSLVLKYIIIAIIGTSCATGLVVANYQLNSSSFEEETPLKDKESNDDDDDDDDDECENVINSINLIVDYAGVEETKIIEDIIVCADDKEVTVFYILNKYCELEYSGSLENKDVYVTSIDGVESDDDLMLYWIYYLNGDWAEKGCSEQEVESGDKIEWVYEDFS